jgi:hypothetical protein
MEERLMALFQEETTREDFAWLPKLMSAVLLQACRDIQDRHGSRKSKDARVGGLYGDARRWFLGTGTEPFDFRQVCTVAGVDYRKVLEKVGPFLCPALADGQDEYNPRAWRSVMRSHRVGFTRKAS